MGGIATGFRQATHSLAVALGIVLCLLLSGAAAHSAQAEEEHSFDALRSLIGGPGTSTADPVPDPGPNHPPLGNFNDPCGTAVDSAGNVYVADFGAAGDGSEGRVDIFDDEGVFITELETGFGSCDVAVDSEGNIYVKRETDPQSIIRFEPDSFPPTSATVYGPPITVVPFIPGNVAGAPTINPADDHLFVTIRAGASSRVAEYGPASAVAPGEPNELLGEFGEGFLQTPKFIAVNGATGEVFVSSTEFGQPAFPTPSDRFVSVVYVYDAARQVTAKIDGSDIPEGGFVSPEGEIAPAVDETTGEVFITDLRGTKQVYRFVPTSGGGYEWLADPELEDHFYAANTSGRIAVSNVPGANNERYVFVTSTAPTVSHLYAFAPEGETGAPQISATSFEEVTETEAILTAKVNPNGLAAVYHFEYVEDAAFLVSGFADASRTPDVAIGGGTEDIEVLQGLFGLTPGTTYHFRVVASNCGDEPPSNDCLTEGERESEGAGPEIPHLFATFSPAPNPGACPNAALRVGPSAFLPDCRAYEAVSPLNNGGRSVNAQSLGGFANGFATAMVTGDGETVAFEAGGSLPGFIGNGYFDRYLATRQPDGWETRFEGATGAQMEVPNPGGLSPDLGTSFWMTSGGNIAPDSGTLVIDNTPTTYVRRADGTFELLGQGDLGATPEVRGRYISSGGAHVIFTSAQQLEVGAPPSGTQSVCDRAADGTLQVVSLLPGDTPVAPGSEVVYRGASADGSVVAFTVTEGGTPTLYLRVDNSTTVPVSSGPVTFGGLSADGSLLTYVKGGDIFSFEVGTGIATQVGSGGQSVLANVSADGSRIYFISTKKLVGFSGPIAGKPNFYFWTREDQSIGFVGVVSPADVTGEDVDGYPAHGLGLWAQALALASTNGAAVSTPDGRFIVFESRANLTGHNPTQELEVYRYDAGSGTLVCVSCNPTLSNAIGGAQLRSYGLTSPLNTASVVDNLADDGQMVFFETSEPLVARDSNGVQDVYEWEAEGVGGCTQPAGCLSLISLGRGSSPSFLYGSGGEGRDVFFFTRDPLVPGAQSGAFSIYDARINGGFPAPSHSPECQLDGCQEAPAAVASPAAPASAAVVGPGNVQPRMKCGRHRRAVKRQGKVRCVKKHDRRPARRRRGAK